MDEANTDADSFPNGSNWGPTELQKLRIPDPESHGILELSSLLSGETAHPKILEQLEQNFGRETAQTAKENYAEFFQCMEKLKPSRMEGTAQTPQTPRERLLRSNVGGAYLGSSPAQNSHPTHMSPTSVSKRLSQPSQPSHSSQSSQSSQPSQSVLLTENSNIDDSDSESEGQELPPSWKRAREESSPSVGHKTMKLGPSVGDTLSPTKFVNEDLPSDTSTTDFQPNSSSRAASDVDDGLNQGAESSVTTFMRALLSRICNEHNDHVVQNEYKFKYDLFGEFLSLFIDGRLIRTQPDLYVKIEGEEQSVLDFEVRSAVYLFVLC